MLLKTNKKNLTLWSLRSCCVRRERVSMKLDAENRLSKSRAVRDLDGRQLLKFPGQSMPIKS